MTASLKFVLPEIADELHVSFSQLYERQRTLVAHRLLKYERGRGPGSGVKATPTAIATMIVAMMASAELYQSAAALKEIAATCTLDAGSPACRLTGERDFLAAVAKIIADGSLAEQVREIRVARPAPHFARIVFHAGKKLAQTDFGDLQPPAGLIGIRAEMTVSGAVVLAVHRIVKQGGPVE